MSESSGSPAPPSGTFIEGDNPLAPTISLFLVQLAIIITTSRIIGFLLKKLNQPAVIAEVIGGILLGNTALCRIPAFRDNVFPPSSIPYLKLVADIGLMLYLFLLGMELDPIKIIEVAQSFKKAAGISIAGIALPFACGAGVSKLLYDQYMADSGVPYTNFFVFCGVAMSITAYPLLARILSEQNLLHTSVGEISLAAAGADDAVAWCLLILVVSLINNPNKLINALFVFFIVVGFGIFLWICIRPIFNYLVENSEDDNGADQFNICFVILTMIIASVFIQAAGVEVKFGAFLVGLIVPHKRGFSIAITEKIEDLVCIMFLPLYFAYAGLKVNLGTLDSPVAWGYVVLVIAVACAGKLVGCVGAALAANIPFRESVAIGILMNTRGLVEFIVLNLGLEAKVISLEVYSIFVVMALTTTLMTVPILKWFYPQKYHQSCVHNLLSVGDVSKPENHFRVLTCLSSMHTVPAMMNLTQILFNAATTPEIDIYALRLKTLDARYSTVMNATERNEQLSTVSSDPVMNVFRTFGAMNKRAIKIVMAIAQHMYFAEEIIQASSDIDASLVIFPIEATAHTYPVGWGKGVANDLFEGEMKADVAFFVDRGFGASTSTNPHEAINTSHDIFVVISGSASDVNILELVKVISKASNMTVSILVIAEIDSNTTSVLAELASTNVKVEHKAVADNDRSSLLLTHAGSFKSCDLIMVSHELFTGLNEKDGFGGWLDQGCNSSVLILKTQKAGVVSDGSTLTIAAVV